MTNVVHAIEAKAEKQERAEYRKLIMEGDDFKVVIDNDGDVYWETTKSYNWENIDDKDIVKFNQILIKRQNFRLSAKRHWILKTTSK